MNAFGDSLRTLMDAKAVTGVQLAADIGITQTSVSRILNGQSRPRQVTLTRIMKRLCESKQEEQALIRAYTGFDDSFPEESILEEDEKNEEEELARAERYLEMKAQSIAFKRSVARELDKSRIPYKEDYCEGIYVTDFLIERNGNRSALECKFNVHRDFVKALTIGQLLHAKLRCKEVIIAVPYMPDNIMSGATPSCLKILTISDLTHHVSENENT